MKEVVDLFEEEMLKEDKKELKKIEKEKSRQKRYEKKLEKMEDEEFAKMLKEDRKEEKEDILENIEEKPKKHSFLNFLLGLSIIILFLASSDYALYNIIRGKDLEQILTASALCVTSVFYILSIIVKKEGIKKFFQVLATLSIASYMCYYLFIA